jgi:hypothetical protein
MKPFARCVAVAVVLAIASTASAQPLFDAAGVRRLHAPVPNIVGPPPDTIPLPGLGANGSVFASPAGYGVVRSAALPAPADRQFKQQQDLAADPGLKIYVAQEGWYRLTRTAMLAAGFDPGKDLKKLSLYVQGSEQPLLVNSDSVEFYGQKLDTFSTGARTYWLHAGQGSANRLPLSHAKGGDPLAGDVAFTYERIERGTFGAVRPQRRRGEQLVWPADLERAVDAAARRRQPRRRLRRHGHARGDDPGRHGRTASHPHRSRRT